MHCHCGTNNRAPRWTFTDPCKPEARPGAREESASPAWLATPDMNARDTMKVYIWKLDTGCALTLYRKCHSHNTPWKRHNNTWVEPLAGNCTTSSTRQRKQLWQKCKIILMHWHCVTMNRAPRLTFKDPCKLEARPGAWEESASPAWLATPATNARYITKMYICIWRLDTGCGPTLYRKCHSHNTPGKRHSYTWVEPLAGNCTSCSTRQSVELVKSVWLNILITN